MLTEHSRFIETADDNQLQHVRSDLEKLLIVLREADVIKDTKALIKAIDQELLGRVMRRHRLDTPNSNSLDLKQAA